MMIFVFVLLCSSAVWVANADMLSPFQHNALMNFYDGIGELC
jgi:hypothetical protein